MARKELMACTSNLDSLVKMVQKVSWSLMWLLAFLGSRIVVDSNNVQDIRLFSGNNYSPQRAESRLDHVVCHGQLDAAKWREALVSRSVKFPPVLHCDFFLCTRRAMCEIRLPCSEDVGQRWDWPTRNAWYEPENCITPCCYESQSVESPFTAAPCSLSWLMYRQGGVCSISRPQSLFREDTVFSRNPRVTSPQLLCEVLY